MKANCCKCNRKAVWIYMPGELGSEFCDEHVPRGCSCNMEPIDGNWENDDPDNWKEITDEKGRPLPCCEYVYDEDGIDIEE